MGHRAVIKLGPIVFLFGFLDGGGGGAVVSYPSPASASRPVKGPLMDGVAAPLESGKMCFFVFVLSEGGRGSS